MTKNIDPTLKSVGEYLKLSKKQKFIIPEYQRPYSWEINQCDKLWQDILDFDINTSDSYFLGTIIINCQDNDTNFGLIDGQQRTITFLLLLKALLIRINNAINETKQDPDSKGLYRGLKARRLMIMKLLYQAADEEIPEEFDEEGDRKISRNNSIVENHSINELYKNDLKSILDNVVFSEVESNVTKIPRKQKDNKYTNYFRNFKFFYLKAADFSNSQLNEFSKTLIEHCEVIEIRSWQVEQAIMMFNSLNSDGLHLYDADIISAKLYAAAEETGKQVEFAGLWKDLIEQIEDLNKSGIADIDAIFMQQMYYERAKSGEIVKENGSINVTTPGLRRYFTEINKNLLNNPTVLCKQLIHLAKSWRVVSNYQIIQILLKFNENAKLFLASYLHRFNTDFIPEKEIREISICLLRLFAVLELVDIGYSSKTFKTFLFGEIAKIANPDIPLKEIIEDFNRHISTIWNPTDIKRYVVEYDGNLLVYLNEFLFAKEKNISFELGTKYDIEHIMPKSGFDKEVIRKDSNIKDSAEFDNYVNKIGNKILLEEKINRTLSNLWFRTKVSTEIKKKTGYKDSRFPIAVTLVNTFENDEKPFWTKEDIDVATEKAGERIVKFIFNSSD